MWLDSLVNLVSGMGTGRDKSSSARYVEPGQDDAQMHAAYKASALVRRAVDLPAEDACREWREWQASAAEISAIEAEESRLGVQRKVMQALSMARLFRGSAILIGTGDADPSLPLNVLQVKRGGIKYLAVMSRLDVNPQDIDFDPTSPTFGLPKHYTFSQSSQKVHPSRLVVFHGIPPLPGRGFGLQDGWGDSVLPGMLDALKRVDENAQNATTLVYESKVDVVKIPDFMRSMASRGEAYSTEVLKRLTLAATGKGISGMLVMDAAEEYEQKSASFSGLPEIMDRLMQLASAAAGIPMTLLFGMSPGGLNASGDADTRGYYDRVKVLQSLQVQPAMAVLDECLIGSALEKRPADLHYAWRPLWQVSAKERAENAEKLTNALSKIHGMDVVSAEAIGKTVVNSLTESGAFPGLEGYAEEFPMDRIEEVDILAPEVTE